MTSLKGPRIRTSIPPLTPRQREVLTLLARGYSNPQIGEALGISLDGAKWHVSEIMSRLGVASREDAAAWWREYNKPAARLARAAHVVWPFAAWARAGAAIVGVGAASAIAVVTVIALNSGGPATALPDVASPMLTASATSSPPTVVSISSPSMSASTPATSSPDAFASATTPSAVIAPLSPTPGFTPTPAYTGVSIVDLAISALLDRDYTALAGLLVTTPVACGFVNTPPGWQSPCAPGVATGTLQQVYLVGGCDGPTWLPAVEAAAAIPAMLVGTPHLYGVRQNSDGTYSAIFADDDPSAFTLTLSGSGITAVARACGAPAEAVLAAGGSVIAGPFT